MPALKPVIPDPGRARSSSCTTTTSRPRCARRSSAAGDPGVYNLAGDGTLTMSDLAAALGWYSVPVPELAVGAAAELVARFPCVPAEAQWIESLRRPVLMDTAQGAPRARLAAATRRAPRRSGDGRGRAPERLIR